jgi:hypothetical protein
MQVQGHRAESVLDFAPGATAARAVGSFGDGPRTRGSALLSGNVRRSSVRPIPNQEEAMATTAQETDQITRTVNLYVEGCRDGDAAKLREAFHPEARMWGSMMGQRYDEPIEEMIALVDGKPVDVDGSYHAHVTAIEQTDDVASATLSRRVSGEPSRSSTSSRWRGSTAAGRSSTRRSSTPGGSHPQSSRSGSNFLPVDEGRARRAPARARGCRLRRASPFRCA